MKTGDYPMVSRVSMHCTQPKFGKVDLDSRREIPSTLAKGWNEVIFDGSLQGQKTKYFVIPTPGQSSVYVDLGTDTPILAGFISYQTSSQQSSSQPPSLFSTSVSEVTVSEDTLPNALHEEALSDLHNISGEVSQNLTSYNSRFLADA